MPGIRASLLKTLAGALVLALFTALVPPPRPAAAATAFLSDTAAHPPPTTGSFAYYNTYGSFGPDQAGFPAKGQSFVEPVFGGTITRLTNELGKQSFSDIYAKNGYTNADNTLVVHNTPGGRHFLDTRTGEVVRANVPGNFESSFAPDDPDTWYWFTFGSSTMNKYSVKTGTSTVVKTFSEPLAHLGGSVDWIDGSGRYMLLHLGSAWRVYDVKSDVLYAGSVPDSSGGGSGWAGISPDGNYIVTTGGMEHRSWAVNHTAKTVSTSSVVFWTLCGDHADLVSASNGKTYFVVFECWDEAAVYAVDVSIPQSGNDRPKQRADNKRLFDTEWSDSGHFSGVSKGALQDWVFVSVESGDDTFGSTVASWRPYKQELVMANVVTGEVRRLAHHRSRSVTTNYYYTPRVSASWDGGMITWVSNFGYSAGGYADLYAMRIEGVSAGEGPGEEKPSPIVVSFTNPASDATVSGTTTVSVGASGGAGSDYTYTVKAGSTTIYTGTNGTFGWNTSTVPNGSTTLTVTATDSGGATGSATRTVKVSNTTPLAMSITTPAGGATVSGTTSVSFSATGGAGSGYTYTLKAGGTTVYTGTSTTASWNTTTVANGSVTLTATVSDGGGATASATRTVTVSNIAPLAVNVTSPAGGATVSGTVTVSATATGGTGGYVYTVKIGTTTVYTGAASSFAWNTATVPNGSITGTVTVTDSAGTSASATRTVTVANATPVSVSFTSPASGTTVSGTTTVSVNATGGSGTGYAYTIKAGTTTISTGPNASTIWSTTGVANGAVTLTATVTDSAGATGTATRSVTVANVTPPTSPAVTTPSTTGTLTPENVVWASPVKVAVSGASITKNTGCSGCWDAGAASQQTIASGNGYVEFKVTAGANTTVGLSTGNPGTGANDIKFALRFSSTYVEVRENGVYKADWRLVAGAVHKIAVENGAVKYYQNGVLKYTSAQAPTYPLLLDSTLVYLGESVQNAVITQ